MRAAVVESPGAVPEPGELPEPEAVEGGEVVEVLAAGVHPVVRGLVSGRHYGSSGTWPQVPGVDAVARTAAGGLAYVGFATDPGGTFAERVAVRLSLPLPDDADPLTLAAGLNPGMSSWIPLRTHLRDPGQACVLVLGATGNAGRLAVQNCRALGVGRVLAAGRDLHALAATTELGATATVPLDPEALADAVGTHQPDLVLDYLWGPVAETVLAALGTRGLATAARPVTYVEIGSSAGATAAVPGGVLRSRAVTLVGSGAGSVTHEALVAGVTEYAGVLASGRFQVDAVAYPLDDVAAAWQDTSSSHRAVVVPPAGWSAQG